MEKFELTEASLAGRYRPALETGTGPGYWKEADVRDVSRFTTKSKSGEIRHDITPLATGAHGRDRGYQISIEMQLPDGSH